MTTPDEPRPGSTVDLSRRMDRMETKYDDLATEVGSLKATITRVEVNQKHAEELNTLRFSALDTAVGTVGTKLDAFMERIDKLITGETQTAQSKQMLDDYQRWREDVDTRLDRHDTFETQGRLLGRIAVLLVTSNVIAIIAAIAALAKPSS